MRLFFLRHGIAEDAAMDQSDADRQLTPIGIARMQAEARGIRRLDLAIETIVTSPLARARETAEIVADELDMRDRLVLDDRLGYGFGLGALQHVVKDRHLNGRILLVGHEPGFSMVSGALIGEASISLKKGGLIDVETYSIEPGAGTLRAYLPPRVLEALGASEL